MRGVKTHPLTRVAWFVAVVATLIMWSLVGHHIDLNQAQHGGFALVVLICAGMLGAQTLEDRRAVANAARVGRALGLGPAQMLDVLELAMLKRLGRGRTALH